MAVKVLFDLPRETHRYFIEPVSETLHLKTMLCSRFLSFFNSLQTSNKMAVRLLSNLCKNNRMTTLGKNIWNIAEDCNCEPIFLTKCRIKSSLKFSILSEENEWKIPILKELVSVRLDKLNIPGFEMDEVSAIIRQLCCGN